MITIDTRGCDYPEACRRIRDGMLTLSEEYDEEVVVLTDSCAMSSAVRRFFEDFYGCQTTPDVPDGCLLGK